MQRLPHSRKVIDNHFSTQSRRLQEQQLVARQTRASNVPKESACQTGVDQCGPLDCRSAILTETTSTLRSSAPTTAAGAIWVRCGFRQQLGITNSTICGHGAVAQKARHCTPVLLKHSVPRAFELSQNTDRENPIYRIQLQSGHATFRCV